MPPPGPAIFNQGVTPAAFTGFATAPIRDKINNNPPPSSETRRRFKTKSVKPCLRRLNLGNVEFTSWPLRFEAG